MGKILLIFLGILVNLEYVSSSEIYRSIYWVPENPLFSSGCSLELKVRQASTVQFVCPNPTTVLEERRTIIQPANMYENMWMVENKSMYDSCNATNGSSVFECNKPDNLHYASVVFNPFTADGGLPFKPGRTYYFLATSDGTQAHIKDRVGGRCSRKNGIAMKFEIYVCGSEDSTCDGKDIGTLQCKRNDQSATPSSSTPVATPTSSVTHCQSCATEAALKATAEGKTAGQGGQAGARNAADDHDAEIRKWRTIAIIALTIAAVPIVVSAFVIVIYKFIKRGKPSDLCSSDKSSNKIKHHSGEHYKNEALDYDFEDGSPVFDCQEGGFPNPDKKPNGVIENKTVVAVKSAPNGKTHTKQDPNCKTITDNARNMAVNSDSKVPQENPLTFAT